MDNFKLNKTNRRAGRAVDGVIGGVPQADNRHYNRGHQLRQSSINNFRSPDGFRSNVQMPLARRTAAPHGAGEAPSHLRPAMQSQIAQQQSKSSRKTAHKNGQSWRRVSFKLAGSLVVLTLLMGGFLFTKGFLKARSIFQGGGNAPALAQNVDPQTLNGEGDGRVNVLLLGRGGEGHDGADLTDTIIIASIDPIQKQASLLSIPRDFWVQSSSGGASKINAVYAAAKNEYLSSNIKTDESKRKAEEVGIKALESKVEDTFGVPIHYYVMLDFQAFVDAINTVGGIDISISPDDSAAIVQERLWDPSIGQHYVLDVQAGDNHFDGQKALMYARSRYTSARGDFDRAERQRMVIVALKDKVLSLGTYGNPAKLSQLIDNFGDHVRSNLSTGELLRIYELSNEIDSSNISSLSLVGPPKNYVTTDMINGQSIVRPVTGLFDYSEIQSFVRNALRDSYLQQESANIAVYNGTKINGLATKKADELKSFGYGVTTVANAPNQALTQTIVVDLTNGEKKYTKHYLEQRFGVTAVAALPDASIDPGEADFVILLGTDANVN